MNEFNKHDFINNTLRLEILGKILIESLEENKVVDDETLSDYLKFSKEQISYLQTFPKAQ